MSSIEDQIEGHRRRNAELLRLIKSKKIAIDQPRSVEHHFVCPTQEKAALLARELYGRGYLILLLGPTRASEQDAWAVEAGRSSSPAKAADEAVTRELVELADRFSSHYDGWGMQL